MKRSWKRPRFIPITGGGSLTKSGCAARLRKSSCPPRLGISNAGLEASRFHAPRLLPRLVCKPSHHSQQMRSIDFDDLDRKKSTGRTLARGIVILRKAGNCIIVSTTCGCPAGTCNKVITSPE